MDHHHHHENEEPGAHGPLSTKGKLSKLLEYWIKHNEDHVRTYLEWSRRAREEVSQEVSSLLEEAAQMTVSMNEKFKQASEKLLK